MTLEYEQIGRHCLTMLVSKMVALVVAGAIALMPLRTDAQNFPGEEIVDQCLSIMGSLDSYVSLFSNSGWQVLDAEQLDSGALTAFAQGRAIQRVYRGVAPVWRRGLETSRANVRGLSNRLPVNGGGVAFFSQSTDGNTSYLFLDILNRNDLLHVSCEIYLDLDAAAPLDAQLRQVLGISLTDQPASVPINMPGIPPSGATSRRVSGAIFNRDILPDLFGEPLVVGMVLSTYLTFPLSE